MKSKKWEVKDLIFYEGEDANNPAHVQHHQDIQNIGYVLRTKPIMKFNGRQVARTTTCRYCQQSFKALFQMRDPRKANCDVELTVDALELAESNTEFLIFTGDGDFAYLIERLIKKGVTVAIVSSNRKPPRGSRRLSTRIKSLINKYAVREGAKPRLRLIDLDSWKNIIKK